MSLTINSLTTNNGFNGSQAAAPKAIHASLKNLVSKSSPNLSQPAFSINFSAKLNSTQTEFMASSQIPVVPSNLHKAGLVHKIDADRAANLLSD